MTASPHPHPHPRPAPAEPARAAPGSADALTLLAVAVTVVLWASAFVGVRAAGHDFSPGALALGRQLAGTAALTVIALVAGRGRLPRLPRGGVLLGVLGWGIGWFALYNVALNTAEQHLDAGTTALLVNVAPILIALLAGVFLGEGLPGRLLAGMVLAFTGVAVIALTTSTGAADIAGVLLGLAAAVLYAAGAIGQKRLLARVDAVTMTWLGSLVGTVACLPFAPALIEQLAVAPISSTMSVLYLGVFPTALAFTTWGYALARTSAGRLASSTYLVPPLAVLISSALLAEVPGPPALLGGALCLAGVAVATLGTRRDRRATDRRATGHGRRLRAAEARLDHPPALAPLPVAWPEKHEPSEESPHEHRLRHRPGSDGTAHRPEPPEVRR